MVKTPCNHCFCPGCAVQVLEATGRCPNYRSEVDTVLLFGSTVKIARVPQEDTSDDWMPQRSPEETDVEFERRWLIECGLEGLLQE
jgi:hypothetical protein